MITLIRGIALSVVVIMLFHVNDIVQEMNGSHTIYGPVGRVLAQVGPTDAVSVGDKAEASTGHETNLMKNLHERQKQLDNREKALKEEERKFETLKREVEEKIEALRALEEKMAPPLEVRKEETDRKYKTLAKMYEATPPDKAAKIFEKMERKTAAEIMLRMNSKKAGSLWAHINRDIGAGIVREITSSQSVDTLSATRIAEEITGEELIKPKTSQRVSTGNIAPMDREVTRAEVNKRETSKSAERTAPPIKLKRNAGLKEEKSQNIWPEGHKPYAIQVILVRDIEIAREYTKRFKEEGIDAYWAEMNLNGKGTFYKILIGHFAGREDALKYMKNNNVDINYPGSFIYKSESEKVFPKKKKRK